MPKSAGRVTASKKAAPAKAGAVKTGRANAARAAGGRARSRDDDASAKRATTSKTTKQARPKSKELAKKMATAKKATATRTAPTKAAVKTAKSAKTAKATKTVKTDTKTKKALVNKTAHLGPSGPTERKKTKPSRRTAALDKYLEGQRAALLEERVTYTHQAESLRAEADLLAAEREPGDVQFDEESGEGDTLAVERERDLALSAQAREAVDDIDAALARIEAGTYGVCISCGESIPKERLKALPQAALCVRCKSGGLGRR